jgi:chromate transporter
MKKNAKLYWTLFTSTFLLSAFTFGGGYVIVSLMKKKFVDKLHWIEEDEMLNLVAIAQSSPGVIAVNASILIGMRVGGMLGVILATIGTILPPLIIISVISSFYTMFRDSLLVKSVLKGMQAGVAAIIVDVIYGLASKIIKDKHYSSVFVMIAAFVATYIFNVNVVLIILVCGVIGAITVLIQEKKKKGRQEV